MTPPGLLPITVSHNQGELTLSLAARHAAANGFRSLRDMCYMLGTSLQAVSRGTPAALEVVSRSTGVDLDTVTRFSKQKLEGPYRTLGGELFCGMLWSQCFRFCPRCVVDDLEQGSGPVWSRPWQRAYWLFDRLTFCPVHEVELFCDEVNYHPSTVWDFSALVRASFTRIHILAKSARREEAGPADRYFASRLAGARKDALPYLDELSFYVAVQFCEYLGAVYRGDRTVSGEGRALRENRTACRERGFEIAREGKEGLFSFFDRRDREIRAARAGKHVIYGSVYRFLTMKLRRPEIRPLADDLREHASRIMVLGPKEDFLGAPLESVVQSVRRASQKYKIDERRVLRLLEDLDIDVETDAGASRSTFAEDRVRHVLDVERDGISIEGAKRDQGFGRSLIKKLVELGAPIRTNLATQASRRRVRYSRSDVDTYFSTLFPRRGCTKIPADYKPVMTARLMVGCSVAELLHLIHLGTLKDVKRLRGEKSLSNLFVRVDEARPHLLLPEHDGLLLRTAASELRTQSETVRLLIRAGLLVGEIRKHPLRRKSQVFVTPASLRAFKAEYVFLTELSGNPGRCKWERLRLEGLGISPVALPSDYVPPGRHVHYFYRRADLT